MTPYVELQVLSRFSLLRGASGPYELFAAAALLGYPALGVSDIGTVAGVVCAWEAQKATGVRSIAGTRVDLSCGRRLLLYPTDRPAWSRITRLLTLGKTRAGKGGCLLHWHDLAPWSEGVIAIPLPHEADADNLAALAELRSVYGRRCYMALSQRRRPNDAVRIDALARQAGGTASSHSDELGSLRLIQLDSAVGPTPELAAVILSILSAQLAFVSVSATGRQVDVPCRPSADL